MKNSLLLSLALGAGWLLCPESLIIVGNSSGLMTWLSIPVLLVVAILFGLTGQLLQRAQLSSNTVEEFTLLREFTGLIPATALSIASYIPLIVLGATALLVTCGYTFNEVFVYWFPNFGFAFLLLGLLTILQFCPEKILHRAQIGFVALAASGLLVLCVSGLVKIGTAPQQLSQIPEHFSLTAFAPLFLIFAGSTIGSNRERPFLIPIAAAVLFTLWIVVSLSYVTPDRLASSTIPFMTTARKVLSDPGRMIMGMVVLSGSCAAFTGLMLGARRILGTIVNPENDTVFLSEKLQRWLLPVLVALLTGLLMITGFAGDELLEVLLRGALILWLLHHSVLCVAALVRLKKDSQTTPIAGALASLCMIAALITLVVSNSEQIEILLFSLSILGISALLAVIWFLINRKHTPNSL
jgi:hypothetical protein